MRVLYVEWFSSHIHTGLDSIWYQLVAATLRSGDGYIDPGKFFSDEHRAVATAFRPPAYPAFLTATSRLFDGSTHTFQIAGCVAGVVTIVLIAFLGRRVGGTTVGLIAAAIASIYPVFLAIDAAVMSETVYVPLVTGAVLAAYAAIDRPTLPRWIVLGGLTGAAILTRADGLIVAPLLIVPSAWLVREVALPRRALLASTAIAACLLAVTPWVIRNHHQLDTTSIATLQTGTALAGANCPATYYGDRIGSWSFECTQRPRQDTRTETAVNDELIRDARTYALDHVERLAIVAPARVLRLWGLTDPVDQARLDAIESRNERWQLVSWLAYLPVAGLAIYGFLLLRKRNVQVIPLIAVIAGVTASAALIYGAPRFRASAEPVLMVAAAVAVHEIWSRSARLTRWARVPSDEAEVTRH